MSSTSGTGKISTPRAASAETLNEGALEETAMIVVALSSVILYLIFIPPFSYYGAAAVTIYSETAIALLSAYVVWKHTAFIPNFKVVGKAALAAVIMGLALYLIPKNFYYSWLGLAAGLGLAIVVYFITLYAVHGLTKDDLKILINKKL